MNKLIAYTVADLTKELHKRLISLIFDASVLDHNINIHSDIGVINDKIGIIITSLEIDHRTFFEFDGWKEIVISDEGAINENLGLTPERARMMVDAFFKFAGVRKR